MRKEIVVKCPHCSEENDVMWDVEKKGFEIHCMHCGKLIMLCCECDKNDKNGCDWNEAYQCCCKSSTTIAREKEKKNIREKVYERFKLWWMLTHGYTIKDFSELIYQYIEFVEREDDCEDTLEDYIQMTGFAGGNIWPCIGEFLECEYQDANLAYLLLDPEEYQAYLNAEGFEEPDHLGDTIKVTTPHGDIVAYDNNDPEYPGISLFFVKKGEDREGPGGVMEFTSGYHPNENADEVTDMVQFRFYPKENPYDEPSHVFALEDIPAFGGVVNAMYISKWDGGIEIENRCKVNLDTREVFDIERSSVDGIEVLDGEFVIINGKQYMVFEKSEYDELANETVIQNAYWRN